MTFQSEADDAQVTFRFVPERIGKEIYAVKATTVEGEAITRNNERWFVVNVIRDRIRVLQVVGRPSWDVRFLRQFLTGNPNVDLISFFILRTADDLRRTSNQELSLIPFPTNELFEEQLGSFDAVVFQNFDYGPYDMARYLPEVRDYVEGGGGLLMLGGDLSFGAGGYAGTAVADVLPVRLPPTAAPAQNIDPAPFRPVLSEAGARHPITRLAFGGEANDALWRALPELPGTNIVLGPTEGATVLAEHPTRRGQDGEAMPVLAIREVGEGRSMALTVDSSWKWSFRGPPRRRGRGPLRELLQRLDPLADPRPGAEARPRRARPGGGPAWRDAVRHPAGLRGRLRACRGRHRRAPLSAHRARRPR